MHFLGASDRVRPIAEAAAAAAAAPAAAAAVACGAVDAV